jgi:hypothetical protein
MTPEAYELSGFALTLQKAGCSKATVADVLKKVPAFLGLDADDRKKIDARLTEDRRERYDKAHRPNVEIVGHDPFGHEAEERKKRVNKAVARDKRIKPLGSPFNPIDLTLPADEVERQRRRLDLNDARKARA